MEENAVRQFESELADALSADDVAAALEVLADRYRSCAEFQELIEEHCRLCGQLAQMVHAANGRTYPGLAWPAPQAAATGPLRRIRAFHPWVLAGTAGAFAAGILIASLLWAGLAWTRHGTSTSPIGSAAPAEQVSWEVPSLSPADLAAAPEFTLQNDEASLTIPSQTLSAGSMEWAVPSVSLPTADSTF